MRAWGVAAAVRPLGVSILAILDAIAGVVLLVSTPFVGKALGFGAGFATLGYGVTCIAVSRGLWKLRTWAWWLGILTASVVLAYDVVTLTLRTGAPGAPLRIVANLVVIIYLIFVRGSFSSLDDDEKPWTGVE